MSTWDRNFDLNLGLRLSDSLPLLNRENIYGDPIHRNTKVLLTTTYFVHSTELQAHILRNYYEKILKFSIDLGFYPGP